MRFFRRRRIDDIFHEAIRKQKYKFVFCAIALYIGAVLFIYLQFYGNIYLLTKLELEVQYVRVFKIKTYLSRTIISWT